MSKLRIWYWIFTGLTILLMGVGAIPNLLSNPDSVALFASLGYPAYLSPFLGAAKLLGVIAIVVPGFTRVKEWAYAGLTFDLAGAFFSVLAVTGLKPDALVFIIGFAVIAGSYRYHHKLLKARAV
ncbi:DoxX family protein [Paenibacillus chartarius]|uniref:DoxX family protein n=1 Tax=Paenibacillus chartarius TaxID=747481 RepID=A0ABV6DN10_9BACL